MKNNTLKLTDTKRKVLLDSLNAVLWSALPEDHPERKAAEALRAELKPRVVTVNKAQGLYVIPCGDDGYSCLGFDVAYTWATDVLAWMRSLGATINQPEIDAANKGTIKGYNEYLNVMRVGGGYAEREKLRCPAQLTGQLIGLEGKRVEVVDNAGDTRRFIVGKSMGWLPCHLEIEERSSTGGGAVSGAPYKSVTVIEGGRR